MMLFAIRTTCSVSMRKRQRSCIRLWIWWQQALSYSTASFQRTSTAWYSQTQWSQQLDGLANDDSCFVNWALASKRVQKLNEAYNSVYFPADIGSVFENASPDFVHRSGLYDNLFLEFAIYVHHNNNIASHRYSDIAYETYVRIKKEYVFHETNIVVCWIFHLCFAALGGLPENQIAMRLLSVCTLK